MITISHRALVSRDLSTALVFLTITILYAFLFVFGQIMEYINAPFAINDSVYGSIFYLTTGFHGFHVVIGTIFLIVCLLRMLRFHFANDHHVGYECAIWYWHFVDVVWLFVVCFIYLWGNHSIA